MWGHLPDSKCGQSYPFTLQKFSFVKCLAPLLFTAISTSTERTEPTTTERGWVLWDDSYISVKEPNSTLEPLVFPVKSHSRHSHHFYSIVQHFDSSLTETSVVVAMPTSHTSVIGCMCIQRHPEWMNKSVPTKLNEVKQWGKENWTKASLKQCQRLTVSNIFCILT